MSLDINTPKGQVTLEQERRAVEIWHNRYPHLVYNETGKASPAHVDAIITRDNICIAVVETKCRMYDLAQFTGPFDERWMVTFEKLLRCKSVAEALSVPLLGFLYLAKDDVLLWAKLWCPEKQWVRDYVVQKVDMQTTVNGGRILRDSAFINMRGCEQLRMPNDGQQTDQ